MQFVKGKKTFEVIEYKDEFGAINLPDAFLNKLKGKSMQDQLSFYTVLETQSYGEYSYGEVDSERVKKFGVEPEDCYDVLGVVVKDDVIVGLWVRQWYQSQAALLVGKCICTYSVSEDDGTGRYERDDYVILSTKE